MQEPAPIPSYITTFFKDYDSHIVALYALTTKQGVNFLETINHIAEEASIGPWNNFWKKNNKVGASLRPKVFNINSKVKTFCLAIPLTLIERDNISQILSIFTGNIYGMNIIGSLKLLDISFPTDVLNQFEGPRFGRTGIRSLTEIYNRPLCALNLRPKLGLDEESYKRITSEVWEGQVDIIFESETMASTENNNFGERTRLIIAEKKRIERETHEFKLYFPNIGAGTIEETIRRLHFLSEMGNEGALMNPLLFGLTGFHSVKKEAQKRGIILYSTRTGYKLFTNANGLTFLTQLKLLRLLGADAINIGNISIHPSHLPMQLNFLNSQEIPPNEEHKVLGQKWSKIKPVLPVVSGGLHPGDVHSITIKTGNEVIIAASEGIFYHPRGIRQGSKALREACNAAGKGVSPVEHARKHPCLKIALEKWPDTSNTNLEEEQQ